MAGSRNVRFRLLCKYVLNQLNRCGEPEALWGHMQHYAVHRSVLRPSCPSLSVATLPCSIACACISITVYMHCTDRPVTTVILSRSARGCLRVMDTYMYRSADIVTGPIKHSLYSLGSSMCIKWWNCLNMKCRMQILKLSKARDRFKTLPVKF